MTLFACEPDNPAALLIPASRGVLSSGVSPGMVVETAVLVLL
jgi:hypothetical protein